MSIITAIGKLFITLPTADSFDCLQRMIDCDTCGDALAGRGVIKDADRCPSSRSACGHHCGCAPCCWCAA